MSSDITPQDDNTALTASMEGDLSQLLGIDTNVRAVHNFPDDGDQAWALSALATGPECRQGADFCNKPFRLRYFFVHIAEVMDDYGEIHMVPRTVLINTEGVAIGFVSNTLYRQVCMMVNSKGKQWPKEGLLIEITAGRSRKGNNVYGIKPLFAKPKGKAS